MSDAPAKIAVVVFVAVLLSCLASLAIANRYRAAMRRLMSAPVAPAVLSAASVNLPSSVPAMPPQRVSHADNRSAAIRLSLLLVGLSVLMAWTGASLRLLGSDAWTFSLRRAAVLSLVDVWPVIPALGLLWRWSARRVLVVLAGWCLLCFGVMLWRSIEPRPWELLRFLGFEIGIPLVLVGLLSLGNATRAVGPWLLPLLVGLVGAGLIGVEALTAAARQPAPWIAPLVSVLGFWGLVALFAGAAIALAMWPVRALGRAIGRAYARRQLSELLVLFSAVWAIALLGRALTQSAESFWAGAAALLPLAWIPGVVWLGRRRDAPGTRAPTLLVLRVFQRDEQVQDLFDHVVERWRLSGNTVLIAGTDLADRTLDAADIFTFLEGGLGRRFIRHESDLASRLAAFELAPDLDGRHRVNECYCHDTSWQLALQALVERSDVVLMDLRSFQAHNEGCRHELGVLAGSTRSLRVVILTDGDTDRVAAQQAAAAAPAGRFHWIDTARIDARKRREVLASLFEA
jgi:hypothetical protein